MAIARIRTVFTGVAGSPAWSNFYFRNTVTQTHLDAMATMWGVIDFWQVDDVSWTIEDEVPVFDETDGTLLEVLQFTGSTGSGTSANEMMSPATQVLLRFPTGGIVNNRRVQGRVYIPYLQDGINANGVPESAARTQITAAYNDNLQAAAIRDTNAHVIWSRPFEPDPADPDPPPARAGSAHTVTGGNVWSQFAVQRSRRD